MRLEEIAADRRPRRGPRGGRHRDRPGRAADPRGRRPAVAHPPQHHDAADAVGVAGLDHRGAAARVAAGVRAGPAQRARPRRSAGCVVKSTPVALSQVLRTLLENSLAHGRGTVDVHARRSGPSVVVEVSDQGDGVAADHRPAHLRALGQQRRARASAWPSPATSPSPTAAGSSWSQAQPVIFALFLSEAEVGCLTGSGRGSDGGSGRGLGGGANSSPAKTNRR